MVFNPNVVGYHGQGSETQAVRERQRGLKGPYRGIVSISHDGRMEPILHPPPAAIDQRPFNCTWRSKSWRVLPDGRYITITDGEGKTLTNGGT